MEPTQETIFQYLLIEELRKANREAFENKDTMIEPIMLDLGVIIQKVEALYVSKNEYLKRKLGEAQAWETVKDLKQQTADLYAENQKLKETDQLKFYADGRGFYSDAAVRNLNLFAEDPKGYENSQERKDIDAFMKYCEKNFPAVAALRRELIAQAPDGLFSEDE